MSMMTSRVAESKTGGNNVGQLVELRFRRVQTGSRWWAEWSKECLSTPHTCILAPESVEPTSSEETFVCRIIRDISRSVWPAAKTFEVVIVGKKAAEPTVVRQKAKRKVKRKEPISS
ncbi:MAG: hypothetical protein G01um1014107_82 [Parcubacteria group bacterium Gr01-1014_107]|nr:MAG: hypothetical protein G01um1014107_82 [Parcubacteria group bacterium Gr01-1014_107]